MDWRTKKLAELELPIRMWNVFKNNDFETIADVLALDEGELLRLPNFGRKSLNEFIAIIAPMGLRIAGRSKRYVGLTISRILAENIQARAFVSGRSLEAEALAILTDAVGIDTGPNPKSLVERIEALERALTGSDQHQEGSS